VIGGLLMVMVSWICRHMAPRKVDKYFRRFQLLSAAAYSLGHGGNDAQKTVGIIWMLLIATGYSQTSDQFRAGSFSPVIRPWGWVPCSAAGVS
jgi:PiT family inorganic phosphate transporter